MSQNVIKRIKDGAILIILVEGYSILTYLFGVVCTALSCLLPQKQVYINPTDF